TAARASWMSSFRWADRDENPRIAGVIEVCGTVLRWLPDTERSDVVMTRGQVGEGIVEDLVGCMQDEIRRLEQLRIALDQGDRTRANVLFDRAGRVRTDIEGAVDHRP